MSWRYEGEACVGLTGVVIHCWTLMMLMCLCMGEITIVKESPEAPGLVICLQRFCHAFS
jgi:hypothetical protein